MLIANIECLIDKLDQLLEGGLLLLCGSIIHGEASVG
jgi:hypothetical protein